MADLKPGWKWVKFGDIAECVNDRVDDPSKAGVDRYVGLDHLDPDNLKIRRWGAPEEVESTKLRFKPGDIIFGKRRAYQRKLAVADFEGICSAHAMVLRAKRSAVLPEFLPFFMQSDLFMERAVAISVGSLSPTINWKTLAAEEVVLPPLQEQRRIAGVLTAASERLDSLRQLAAFSGQAERASIVDLLMLRGFQPTDGRSTNLPPDWVVRKGQDVLVAESGNGEPTCHEKADHLFFKVADFNRNADERHLDVAESRFDVGPTRENARIRLFSEGTIVFPKRGASIFLNKVGVLGTTAALDPNLMAVSSRDSRLLQRYLYWFCKGVGLWRLAETTSVPQLNHKHLYAAHVLIPPVGVQERLCDDLDRLRLASVVVSERLVAAGTQTRSLFKECGL